MDVIILTGGEGTRLRRTVGDRPKPLAEVAARPFVEWLLLALRTKGLRRVLLATGYKGEMIEVYFGNGVWLGATPRYQERAHCHHASQHLSLLPSAGVSD